MNARPPYSPIKHRNRAECSPLRRDGGCRAWEAGAGTLLTMPDAPWRRIFFISLAAKRDKIKQAALFDSQGKLEVVDLFEIGQ